MTVLRSLSISFKIFHYLGMYLCLITSVRIKKKTKKEKRTALNTEFSNEMQAALFY